MFLNRLLMYFAIWWTGVWLAEMHFLKRAITYRSTILCTSVLLLVTLTLAINVVVLYRSGSVITLGIHPMLELRHFGFALLVVLGAILWQRLHWKGFNHLFGHFTIFAPISYGIYIAHYHVMTSATYFDFVNQPILEWFLYFFVLIGVSWLLERQMYPQAVRLWLHLFNPIHATTKQ